MVNQPIIIKKNIGINQWDEEWELGYIKQGNNESTDVNIRTKNYIPVLPNTTYYLSKATTIYAFYYDSNKTFLSISSETYGRTSIAGATAFTTPANAYYMRFYLTSSYGTTYNNDISVNYPSTDTSYHPYYFYGLPRLNLGENLFDESKLADWGCTLQSDGSWLVPHSTTLYTKVLCEVTPQALDEYIIGLEAKCSSNLDQSPLVIYSQRADGTGTFGSVGCYTRKFWYPCALSVTSKTTDYIGRFMFTYGNGTSNFYIRNVFVRKVL